MPWCGLQTLPFQITGGNVSVVRLFTLYTYIYIYIYIYIYKYTYIYALVCYIIRTSFAHHPHVVRKTFCKHYRKTFYKAFRKAFEAHLRGALPMPAAHGRRICHDMDETNDMSDMSDMDTLNNISNMSDMNDILHHVL